MSTQRHYIVSTRTLEWFVCNHIEGKPEGLGRIRFSGMIKSHPLHGPEFSFEAAVLDSAEINFILELPGDGLEPGRVIEGMNAKYGAKKPVAQRN